MLGLVLRRAREQRRLLTAVIVLVATAATLVGVCTLLLGATADRAFRATIEHQPASDLSVTAFLVELDSSDVEGAAAEAGRVVEDVLAPMRPHLETTATSRLRLLDDGDRQAYLMMADGLADRADLTSGRWPSGEAAPAEAVVPATTARLLDLGLGDEVTLGRESGLGGVDAPVTVVVVGTFRPRSGVEWERDPLGGSGFSAAYSDGLEAAPTYGPFVVGESSFLASGSSVRGLRVTAHPTRERASDATLRDAADSLGEASGLLSAGVGDRARITRLASDLPLTLTRLHAQQASTRATVLVVLLLGSALALAAALLAGRLVATVRQDERDLLRAMGLARRQQVLAAGTEALLLSLVAATVAVPASALVHSRLTHLPDLAAAGLQQDPSTPWSLVLAVLASAVVLTAALVATTLAPAPVPGPRSRRGALARLGIGPVLLAAAAAAWWQVRTQPATAADSGDLTLTLAPVLCVAALTVLGVRTVPVVLSRAARAGARSRSLIWPLATQQAARRPDAGTAMVLIAASVAAAVLGLSLRTTWERSQVDQAALRVGTDAALTLPAPAGPAEAEQVEAAVRDRSVLSAVIHRPLALGRFVGEAGSRPVLVAVDTREAGVLLRGRTAPGTTWAAIGARLAPDDSVAGVPLPTGGAGITFRGQSPRGATITVVPTAVVEDRSGFRSSVSAAVLPLDGASHEVQWLAPMGADLQLVAVRLELDGSVDGEPGTLSTRVMVRMVVDVPSTGDGPADGPAWRLEPLQKDSPVAGATAGLRTTGSGTELRAELGLNLDYFSYTGADLLATAFPVSGEVPVVASRDLVDAVGAKVGDQLSAIVGDAVLVLEVARVVPSVPSAPGQVAVLADVDALSRALIDAGRLDPVVDAWWVGRPTAGTVQALRELELGDVTVRQDVAEQLSRGPLRVAVPTTLLTLVALAVALLLAAVGLVLGAERQRRAAEVVRLRALGLSRRDSRRLLVVEHLAFFVPVLLVGVVVGLAAAALLGPHLVRSDLGATPVPSPIVTWPWLLEGVLVGGLLLGTVAVTAVLSDRHVRSSEPARVRTRGQ
ncbi:FtsX-like permease family protein [Nocardioides zhouii]|uniref:FtsX-like permease family protein n=1 Tax=Nocardioides zhouii TaxID=1168729 RepID=A0A4Q2SSB7_9ACTN|nr:ABC transporter permease [Nocardioides zhouii]RYC07148.1 FtsX-like permease family protein [Nocardioides zhouii]